MKLSKTILTALIITSLIFTSLAAADSFNQSCSISSANTSIGFNAVVYNFTHTTQDDDQSRLWSPTYEAYRYKKKKILGTASGITNATFSYTKVNSDRFGTVSVYGVTVILNYFTVELTGYFKAPETGVHTFVTWDDPYSARVDYIGSSAFDCCDTNEQPESTDFFLEKLQNVTSVNRTLYLEAGSYYPMKIVYTNFIDWAQFQLRVITPSGLTYGDRFGELIYQFPNTDDGGVCRTGDVTTFYTQTTWTGAETSTTTITGSDGGVTVVTEVPAITTFYTQTTWTGTETSVTTTTGSDGDVTVITEIPSSDITTFYTQTTWTGTETSVTTTTGSDGDVTVFTEIPGVPGVPVTSEEWITTTFTSTNVDGVTTITTTVCPVCTVTTSAAKEDVAITTITTTGANGLTTLTTSVCSETTTAENENSDSNSENNNGATIITITTTGAKGVTTVTTTVCSETTAAENGNSGGNSENNSSNAPEVSTENVSSASASPELTTVPEINVLEGSANSISRQIFGVFAPLFLMLFI